VQPAPSNMTVRRNSSTTTHPAAGASPAAAFASGSNCGSHKAQPVSNGTSSSALKCAAQHIAAFAGPQEGRSAWVVGATVLLWVGTLLLGNWWFSRAQLTTWKGLAVSACWLIVRMGTYVRAFVMMHDATHNTLFKRRWLNTLAGNITGLMVGMHAAGEQTGAAVVRKSEGSCVRVFCEGSFAEARRSVLRQVAPSSSTRRHKTVLAMWTSRVANASHEPCCLPACSLGTL
jgi:hypothetical protein